MNKQVTAYYSVNYIEKLLDVKIDQLWKIANRAGAYYNPYDVRTEKPDGRKKLRHIDNPNEELKAIQRKILKRILLKQMLSLPDGMIGGVAGKSIKNNAQPHTSQPMVVTIDIKDCFPSITHHKIYNAWISILGYGDMKAALFTKLTSFRSILPQGAPTSTALCNLCLLPLFSDIKDYADAHGISFTLYVDDITISGKVEVVLPAIGIIIKNIQKYGFGVRREKIGIMPANTQQKVTGLNTNKKVNLAQRKIEEVRSNIITIAKRKQGITKRELNSIKGNIHFIYSVRKEKAEKLRELAILLLPKDFAPQEDRKKSEIKKCRHHTKKKIKIKRIWA